MAVEVVSPDDESWLKFDHYAVHGVDEVLIADPADRSIAIFCLMDGAYERTDRSALLDLTAAALVATIDWPD
jgi:Uma2 family endonuclease